MLLKKHIFLLFIIITLSQLTMAQKLSNTTSVINSDSIRTDYISNSYISIRDSVVNYGKLFLNTPYRYGSTGTSYFDCSGFTSYVFRNFGYNLDRCSLDQSRQFETVNRDNLKTGDLVFFSGRRKSKTVGHVGIVVSANEENFEFIHASVSNGVIISNSDEAYYSKRFIKANRVIGQNELLAVENDLRDFSEIQVINPAKVDVRPQYKERKKTIPAKYHRVKSGETLSSISLKYGISVAELKQNNKLKNSKLKLKQQLKIKDAEKITEIEEVNYAENASAEENQSVTEANQANSNSTHIVEKGETLGSIASNYGVTVAKLKELNKLKSNRLSMNQTLKVRDVEDDEANLAENTSSKSTPNSKKTEEELQNPNSLAFNSVHKVEKGETLTSIAAKYGTTVAELKKQNNLKSNYLSFNQQIKVKDAGLADAEKGVMHTNQITKKAESGLTARNMTAANSVHAVGKGETLTSIATKYGTTVAELKRLNNLQNSSLSLHQQIRVADVEIADVVIAEKGTSNTNHIAKKTENVLAAKEMAVSNSVHKVEKGETLTSIAGKFGTTVAELKRMNDLHENSLSLNQLLKVKDVDNVDIASNEKSPSSVNQIAKKTEKVLATKGVAVSNSIHAVEKGETLTSIAAKYGITVTELKRLNDLQSSSLSLHQQLKITKEQSEQIGYAENAAPKVSKGPKNTENAGVEINTSLSGFTHKVKKGESLYSISKQYNVSIDDLKLINHLDASSIRPGDELKLSADTKANNTQPQHEMAEFNAAQRKPQVSGKSQSSHKGVTADTIQSESSVLKSKTLASENRKKIIHKVRPGDSYYSIAKTYGCTVSKLKEWNNRNNNVIKKGDVIYIYSPTI